MLDSLKNVETTRILALWLPITFVLHISFWVIGSMVFPVALQGIPDKVVGMLQTLVGLHGGWCGLVINYYFSSSASSARKDEIIAQSAPATKL